MVKVQGMLAQPLELNIAFLFIKWIKGMRINDICISWKEMWKNRDALTCQQWPGSGSQSCTAGP